MTNAELTDLGTDLDIETEVDRILSTIGVSRADTGATLTVDGVDPVLPSRLRIGAIGAIAAAVRNLLVAGIWMQRGGRPQTVHVDLRTIVHSVSPVLLTTLNGYPIPPEDPGNAFQMRFLKTADDRHVMALNPYPKIRDRMAAILDCRNSVEVIKQAVAQWKAADLETAAQQAGAICAMIRTPEEWAREPQYDFVARRPLIELERIGDAPPEPLPPSDRPLSGVRALGYAHVLAGPHLGSLLAEQGADVLNIWEPNSVEMQLTYCNANAGIRSAIARLTDENGQGELRRLLESADVVFTNRRPSRVASVGLTADDCAAVRPGIIHVSYTCFGHDGPWESWAGFDPQALAVTGLNVLEGSIEKPRLPATGVLNDFVAGALGAAGALAALHRRGIEGGSWRVRINLARCSMWFASLGLVDPTLAGSSRENTLLPPRFEEAETPLGRYRRVPSQVTLSETPPWLETPLVPRGSGALDWSS
jgi:crotonobetainyl-CoA:carnitine CoA-transferase CaiB-like acyl-CoA transferase